MASSLKAFAPPLSYTPSHSKKASASPDPLSFLELCSSTRELRQILPQIIKHELYYKPFIQTKLVALFSRFAALREASLVFDAVITKTDELYHSILKGHAHHSSLDAALSFYITMKHARVRTVVYNLTYLLKSCGDNSDLRRGREIHSQLVTNGFSSNIFAMTAVMNMYAKCRQIDDARKMFDRMPERDLVAWNATVAGYAQNGLAEDAFEMVLRLQEDGKKPDSITLVSILPACAATGSLKIGCSIHAYALRACLESLVNVSTALVDMHSKCGALRAARLVFDRMRVRNVVSWNSMIDGYAQGGNAAEAMTLFRKMLAEGVQPTDVTAMAVLHACGELADVEEGKSVHELLSKIGLCSDSSVMNCLITMYCKCKRPDNAAEIFETLPEKTLVSWNAMISGYAQNGRAEDALRLFCRMHSSANIQPDSFTLVSVIPALADVSMLRQAKWIHGHAIRLCLDQNIFVMTALVDMYAKCGGLSMARKLFDSMDERHVTTWNAMIDGYGSHGFGRAATELFEEMRKGPVRPNDVTFLCILSACSHSGLVDEGKRYFESMKHDYRLEPAVDHYGTMVDLLGRAGRLDEAWEFIEKMPIKPSISVYGAMLGAMFCCRTSMQQTPCGKKLPQ